MLLAALEGSKTELVLLAPQHSMCIHSLLCIAVLCFSNQGVIYMANPRAYWTLKLRMQSLTVPPCPLLLLALCAAVCCYGACLQMIVDAPEQTTALGSDAIRSIMGRLVNVYPNRIFVYQTRTINNPQGQPSTAVSFPFFSDPC